MCYFFGRAVAEPEGGEVFSRRDGVLKLRARRGDIIVPTALAFRVTTH